MPTLLTLQQNGLLKLCHFDGLSAHKLSLQVRITAVEAIDRALDAGEIARLVGTGAVEDKSGFDLFMIGKPQSACSNCQERSSLRQNACSQAARRIYVN